MPAERTPRDEAKDLIERQQREIARLRDELARADQRRREVERERDRFAAPERSAQATTRCRASRGAPTSRRSRKTGPRDLAADRARPPYAAPARRPVPLEKIVTVLRERFGVTVTAGGLAQLLHRTATRATPTYTALCEQVRGSPMVSPDETGWRVGGVLHWLRVFATPDTTVYAIRPGRSFDDAATILDPAFDGVLIRDGWAPYRQFSAALHQTCVTHLLRRPRTLGLDHPRSPWARAVEHVLLDGLALRDRRDADAISEHGLAVARGRLLARVADLINTAPALPAPSASPRIWRPRFRRSSPFCTRRASMRRTGARNRRFVRPSSCVKSVAAIARRAGPTHRQCSPASCAPSVSGTLISPTSSPRSFVRQSRSSPSRFTLRLDRITR